MQGPYPVGTGAVQPQLQFVIPGPHYKAHDQTFRMIIRPDLLAEMTKLRFSNWTSARPIVLDGVFIGLQASGASIVGGTNYPVLFSGEASVVLEPGQSRWSDPTKLAFVRRGDFAALAGRKLAISFHVQGDAEQIGWQAESFTTSFISRPGSGSLGSEEDGLSFTEGATSWFILDAIDMLAFSEAQLVVAFGDSITNGSGSTLNGDDRWTDVLSLRLHRSFGQNVSVVNAGIGGNQVIEPVNYSKAAPVAGGPAGLQRIERDIFSLSGTSTVIWTEGINDLAASSVTPETILSAMKIGVAKIRTHLPHCRVLLGTLPSAFGSDGAHGTADVDRRRQQLNKLIRTSTFVEGIVDFDKATIDLSTGALKQGFATGDAGGPPLDRLHPSRAGYFAMGMAVDLNSVVGFPQQP